MQFGSFSLCLSHSHHLFDECINEFFSVSEGTISLSECVSLDLESTKWRREFEWPEEVVGFLEFWSTSSDFVDQIFNARDTNFAEFSSNDGVVSKWNSASVNLTVSSLVDQVGNGLSRWESVSHKWLNDSDHVPGSLVKLNEGTVMELSQSKELQDLLWLWSKLVDTK